MAKYRSIETKFWSDTKIVDCFTPEDRYFYLYLLTNEKVNQLGIYEISITQISRDTGYNEDSINKLLNRFTNVLDIIFYDFETKEIFLKNWNKYNWTNSIKVKKCIENDFKTIKSKKIIEYIYPILQEYIPYGNNKEEEEKEKKEINKEKIFDFLEKEFGRSISSTEYEVMLTWEYDYEVIILAIKEAVLNQARNIKYVDKVLYDWTKQGLKSKTEVEDYLKKRRKRSEKTNENNYYKELI